MAIRKKKEIKDEYEGVRKENTTLDKRNEIIEKARIFIETGEGELLNKEEEMILHDIGGVIYIAYKKTIECIDNKKGEIKDEQGR